MPGPRESDSSLQPPCAPSAAQALGTVPFRTEEHWKKSKKTCPITEKQQGRNYRPRDAALPPLRGRRVHRGPDICDSKSRMPGGRLPENQLGVPLTSCYQVRIPQEEMV